MKRQQPDRFKCKHISHARRNSITHYFYHVFVPESLGDKSRFTPVQYERAVYKLVSFTQRDITLGEITEGLIDRMTEYCIQTGMRYDTARKYRCYLRAIVRHARPGTFPKASGKRPHEPEPDAGQSPDDELDQEGSLWRFFQQVYKPTRLVGRTSGKKYQTEVRRLAKYLGRAPMVSDLTDAVLIGVQKWLLENGYSASTVNGTTVALRTLWREAHQNGLLETMPRVGKVPEPKRLPEAWSLEELGRMIDATNTLRGTFRGLLKAFYFRAYILLAYETALRARAIRCIRTDQLDLSTGWLTVPAENTKARVEQRFRLTADTCEAIRKIWDARRPVLFPGAQKMQRINAVLGRILEVAGLPNNSKTKTHKLRRTCATQLTVAAGIGAAVKQLGHSSETVTRGYVDPRFLSEHDLTGVLPSPLHKKGT